jgi:SAM-dependent methyltransferase
MNARVEAVTVDAEKPAHRGVAAAIVGQFGNPRGLVGRLVGHVMAVNNRKRSAWVLSLLALRETDRVLEVGFGPGADIRRVAQVAVKGLVVGVEHSKTMLSQASSRNCQFISEGRVQLREGSAEHLPFAENSCDKAFSINSVQFWNDLDQSFAEAARVLRPGGLLATAIRPRNAGADESTSREWGRRLAGHLQAAGFTRIDVRLEPSSSVPAVCVLATNGKPLGYASTVPARPPRKPL